MSRRIQADSDDNTRLPVIEVDLEATDNSSSYGQELSSVFSLKLLDRLLTANRSAYSTSLSSSALEYRYENGRRYHGYRDGKYLGPNDEQESDRLDMLHEMLLVMMNRKLFLAPIESSPGCVLDLGAGTGIWVMDFADNYPSAEVIGMDLSPIQPQFVPPNARFLVDDFEDDWIYQDQFDFIHGRYLAGAVKDWRRLMTQAYKYTKPGGWVEFQDWDVNVYSEDDSIKGTSVEKYYSVVCGSFTKAGFTISPGPHLGEWLQEAGFEEIHVQKYRAPVGGWPKDKYYKTIGVWNLLQAETGFEAGAMAVLTRFEGWSKEEVNVLVSGARKDVRDPKVHTVADFYVVHGRKPKRLTEA
ncbi:S-adenosyl-L-methionine-dependent methyltransferase [Aspergillus pseudotamarii]|uniref:S-adenosyl-L-methionine-dependent methyltransferase n=1 Tax=Aspergillus pseudotamarii TaxID=132259 RepID=A0A5N6SKC3_ASPPS|nr:S-adenosyl-L-methionine-dependent methyltransferase [Aspergillus pseudotamarii]KAE8133574.1 S-adenosyl-L-methionine-dependent methyltransferase [Aspergillus pseudotamarii]